MSSKALSVAPTIGPTPDGLDAIAHIATFFKTHLE